MPRNPAIVALILIAFATSQWVSAAGEKPDYPPTRTVDVVDDMHGVKIPDPYRWLEDSDSEAVREWTAAQNRFTREHLDAFPAFREKLLGELIELNSQPDFSTPKVHGERYFYKWREGDQNHGIVYVRAGALDAEPRAVLNPNTWSEDGTVALDWWYPSPTGKYIAYGKSANGSERSTLYVRDVDAGEDLDLEIPWARANEIAWDPDEQGFMYIRYPDPATVKPEDAVYFRHVFYHKLGADWRDDPKVFGDGQPREQWHDAIASSDYQWHFVFASLNWSVNDLYIRHANTEELKPVAVGLDGQTQGDVYDGKLYLFTSVDAPRYRVVVTTPGNPGPDTWKELIPQQAGVIEQMQIVGGKIVLRVLENVQSRVLVFGLDGELERELDLPPMGRVRRLSGLPNQPTLLLDYESFLIPPRVYAVNVNNGAKRVVMESKADRDAGDYETSQQWCQSKDGTRIPMFVLHRRGVERTGDNPTILYGYGGFENSIRPTYMPNAFPWLDRGGVYVLANIRGGGEFGSDWHEAGRLERKQNVYDDFIAAAEYLIAEKYTDTKRLGIRGGSNGGLLVGAVTVQRPDLFQAVQCAVPLLDMLRYQRFSIGRLWVPEYGDPEDAEQFKFIYKYSPYQHVVAGTDYPAVLFTTATSDSRVDPSHARKMAARMQAATGSDRPILLWVEDKAGHGQGKPLSMRLQSTVDYLTFFAWQLGMIEPPEHAHTHSH